MDGAEMQSFHDGAPPPPPVSHSWAKIERWLEKNYQELYDNLCEGCTLNDVNELEHELDCTLPLDVRESLQLHDGQERGGLPTGIIFGCMLLDCEEIVQEWKNWRTVNEEFLNPATIAQPQPPAKALGGSSSAAPQQQAQNPLWRQELLERQDSQPPGAIQKAYAHPGWIPLARDWGGNNIAIDLAPGPAGKWGQVIIFGRDYDCKYVIARSWAHFLAMLADDLTSDKVHVEEETGELKLKEFKNQNVEPSYLEILRWRVDQKYGRRPPRRKTAHGLGVNTNANGKATRDSPYGSPTPGEERGRSPHPKTQFGISSPLARVTEEASSPVSVNMGGDKIQDFATKENLKTSQGEDLMEVATPIPEKKGEDRPAEKVVEDAEKAPEQDKVKEKVSEKESKRASSTGLDAEALGEMKNVAI